MRAYGLLERARPQYACELDVSCLFLRQHTEVILNGLHFFALKQVWNTI